MAHKETKFRAWDKNRQWLGRVVSIDFDKQLVGFEHEDAVWFASFEDVELLEYTGYKDNHNKEIYRGDILAGASDCGDEKLDVFWSDTYGGWYIFQCGHEEEALIDHLDGAEVVGNIYEHQHLLGSKEKVLEL